MGQAWCKERTTKAQDSKSPLDRVFMRCAHRIYPSLKEEGSVLGGATQRVTSSEIGYAGSPPREILARGRSIDSADRPFHPSDWVDVNLEVPSPPRANLTVNTSPCPVAAAAPASSSCPSNVKDVVPVPPPRRKKRNRGSRSLPIPKPDGARPESGNFGSSEPLCSPTIGDGDAETWTAAGRICGTEDARHEGRRTKEIYEHKVNGTGRIISSDVVSGRRTSADKKTWRTSEPGHHHRKVPENEEHEKPARSQSTNDDSSSPNRQDRRKSKEPEKRIRDSSSTRDDDKPEVNTRPKNYSTVSLPNYDELDVSARPARRSAARGERAAGEKTKRPVRSSTGSLPAESFLSPFSEKTSVRFEDYIPRRGSIEHLSPYQVLGKLGSSENEVTDGGFMKYDPSKLEDWDLSDISNCDSNRRASAEDLPRIEIHGAEAAPRGASAMGVDVVDYSRNAETGEAETTEIELSCVRRVAASPSLQKPETFGGKSPLPEKQSEYPDDLLADRNSPLRYLEAPKMSEVCQVSPACEPASPGSHRGEPFFLNEELHRSALDTIGGSGRNGAVVRESDRSAGQSRLIFGRSLSNESEPYDEPYESKELLRARPSDVTSKLIRTISEESLPREMLEVDGEAMVDFFDQEEASAKNGRPDRPRTPSPEPRIKAQILDNDHSSLLKVLNDEAAAAAAAAATAADGSNLSSMTPSLTELEVALSDMLEREDQPEDQSARRENADEDGKRSATNLDRLLEPRIVPEKRDAIDDRSTMLNDGDEADHRSSVSLEQILGGPDSTPKTRKVSFCAWPDKMMAEVDLRSAEEPATGESGTEDSVARSELGTSRDFFENVSEARFPVDEEPLGKSAAGRLPQSFDDATETPQQIPTPPRRRNRSSGTVVKELVGPVENHREEPDPCPNDRLI